MARLSFRIEEKKKNFPEKQKLKFITTRLALQKMLEGKPELEIRKYMKEKNLTETGKHRVKAVK